ncbi:MAG: hypothetical protein FWC73_01630 [Defluviitaleaceae bacterium]|nr:hypothetical protein [Defluviitaleaceae bacterium]
MTDTLLKTKAMDVLVKTFGVVEAERFIALVLREPFDYTEWRRDNLVGDITVSELNRQATEYWNNTKQEVSV